MICRCLINVLNQAAVAQSSSRAAAVLQDQRQCSKHFGPRINTISINQLTAAYSSFCNLLPIIFTPKFYRETASSTGAGKSINANAYSRCSMAITWTSRTQLRNMENHALFPSSHPKFQDIKRQKKMSPNMLPLQAPPDHQDSAPLR